MSRSPFTVDIRPDWQALVDCFMRRRTPARVHHIELFLDWEIEEEICRRYGVLEGLDPSAPEFPWRRSVALQRFLGYDYVRGAVENLPWQFSRHTVQDSSALRREGGRSFVDLHTGPITNWEEFEKYPWPDPAKATTNALEWYEKNLPDDMCVMARGIAHYGEHLTWLMGYETLCYALYDQRDLVQAIYDRIYEIDMVVLKRLLQFNRLKAVWASDDMGHRTGTLIGPDDTRQFILAGHKAAAAIAHAAGRPYILHSCGNLDTIIDDLIDVVKIDAKHSFEDVIEPVEHFHGAHGKRVGVLGGIDVDLLCRADEETIRRRVRNVLDACGTDGYCLGTGNSVANYIPVDHYLAMVDEGRRWGR